MDKSELQQSAEFTITPPDPKVSASVKLVLQSLFFLLDEFFHIRFRYQAPPGPDGSLLWVLQGSNHGFNRVEVLSGSTRHEFVSRDSDHSGCWQNPVYGVVGLRSFSLLAISWESFSVPEA